MSYAIVGFGKIGQTLAHAFARKHQRDCCKPCDGLKTTIP
jgi:hypothetical protein